MNARTAWRPLTATAAVLVALAAPVALAPSAGANAPTRQVEHDAGIFCTGTTDDGREFNLFVQSENGSTSEVDLSVSVPYGEGGDTWFGEGTFADGVVDVHIPLGPDGSGPEAVFTGTYTPYGDPIQLRDHVRMDNWTLNGKSAFQPLQLTWTRFEPSAFTVAEASCEAMATDRADRWSQPHRTVVKEGQPAIEVGAGCAKSPVTSVAIFPAEVQYLMVVTTPDAVGYAFVSPDRGTDTGTLQWVVNGTGEISSTPDVTVSMARAGQPRHQTAATGDSTVVTTTTPQQLTISTALVDGTPWSVSCTADVVSHHFSAETPAG